MKICAIICEYNPFHNGHLYQLQRARELTNADAILCVMSGNFTQRGSESVLEKHIRAKHAIQAGADVVLELPSVFATSNAEIFAKGAVKILSSIPDVSFLSFGTETTNANALLNTAKLLNNEPIEISKKIKDHLATGMSYAKARALAWIELIPEQSLLYPNNILALEYTKALLSLNSTIQIVPIERIGGGYSDTKMQDNFSSASAIRLALSQGKDVSKNIPDFVSKNLKTLPCTDLDRLEKYAILSTPAQELAKVCDCTEGLENALKDAAQKPLSLVESLTSARYTSSRIRRIALQNLLKIDESFIRECLQSTLYLRILGIKKGFKELLSALSESPFPILARAHDENRLTDIAKQCWEKDKFAEKIYSILTKQAYKQPDIFI